MDDEVDRYFLQNNHSINFCPKKGERFFLRQESNLAKCGRAINMTKLAHLSLIEIAKNALASFPGMPCIGLDVLCKDITTEAIMDDYAIIEVNSSPGLAMHKYPSLGSSEDVDDMLANVIFPDFFK